MKEIKREPKKINILGIIRFDESKKDILKNILFDYKNSLKNKSKVGKP